MKGSSVFMVIMAVVVLMTVISGCTSTSNTPVVQVETTKAVTYTPAQTPLVTFMPTSVPVPTRDTAAIADKAFVAAAEACIAATPVISNASTQLDFTTCMQNTPDPKGDCAADYKYNILRATKDDVTSAGYSRENKRIPLVQDAYSKNLSYNTLTDTVEACSSQPMNAPV